MLPEAPSPPPAWLGRCLSPIVLSDRDVSYFDAFRRHIVTDFHSWIDPGFWDVLVMRESMQDESVRHCVLGLAAMTQSMWVPQERIYEVIRNPSDFVYPAKGLKMTTNIHHQAALGHYQAAVSTCRRKLEVEGPTPTAADLKRLLISTTIFSIMEMMQGEVAAAANLVINGRHIVESAIWRDASLCSDEEFALAERIFNHFAQNIGGLSPASSLAETDAKLEFPTPSDSGVPGATAPTATIQSRWSRLFWPIHNLVMGFAQGSRLNHPLDQGVYNKLGITAAGLDQWQMLIEDRVRKTQDQKVRRGLLLNKVQVLVTKVYLSYCRSLTDAAYDSHVMDFREIVDIAQSFTDVEYSGRMRFTVGFNLLPWLIFTVAKCRDHEVRKSALETFIRLVFLQAGWGNLPFINALRAIVDIDKTVLIDGHGLVMSVPKNSWSLARWDCSQRRVWMHCTLPSAKDEAMHDIKDIMVDY